MVTDLAVAAEYLTADLAAIGREAEDAHGAVLLRFRLLQVAVAPVVFDAGLGFIVAGFARDDVIPAGADTQGSPLSRLMSLSLVSSSRLTCGEQGSQQGRQHN